MVTEEWQDYGKTHYYICWPDTEQETEKTVYRFQPRQAENLINQRPYKEKDNVSRHKYKRIDEHGRNKRKAPAHRGRSEKGHGNGGGKQQKVKYSADKSSDRTDDNYNCKYYKKYYINTPKHIAKLRRGQNIMYLTSDGIQ